MAIRMVYLDPMANYFHSLMTTAPLTLSVAFIVLLIFSRFAGCVVSSPARSYWTRSVRILNGERARRCAARSMNGRHTPAVRWMYCFPEIQFASDWRSRMDTLIRSYAAQDNKTGLNNRLFFDNQLATLLDDPKKWGHTGWS